MFHKTLIATLLAASGASAFCVDYYVVAPLPGKQHLVDGIAVALSTTPLPTGVVGVAYQSFDLSSALQVKGDASFSSTNVGWSVVAGALPAGLTLNKGVISGTPTAAGAQTFTARATYKTKTGEQAYQLVTYAVTVALATGTLPQGEVGVAYPAYDLKPLLTVSGAPSVDLANVTWSVVSNTLPAGLTLKADGTISGTPSASGTGTLVARASYKGVTGEQTYQVVTFNVTVALASAPLPFITQGVNYTHDFNTHLSVAGDSAFNAANVAWRVASGILPPGLALSANGVLSGTVASISGTSTGFTVAADYKTKTAQQPYTLNAYSYDPYAAMVALYIKGDSDVTDKSSNRFVPSITGSVTRVLSPDVHGSALDFNNGYLTLPASNALKLGLNDFTVEFWMKSSTGNDTHRRIISSTVGEFSPSTFIMRHGPGVFYTLAGETTTAIPLNTWTHLAYSRTAGIGRLFIGGALADAWTDPTNYSDAIQYIGGYFREGEYYSGALDDIRITNGVGRYTSNFTPVKVPYPDR